MRPAFSIGDVLAGKYRIDRVVGEGGMGVVLAATHLDLEEAVAVKVLHDAGAQGDQEIARFLREGKAAARIRSEHIVRVRDVGRLEGGAPFMVMELLEGADLAELLEKQGPLPISVAVDYVLQACEALAEAHAAGIVHRDLKPSNLFLTHRRSGRPCVKVLDFGISKMNGDAGDKARTATTAIFGSPAYMSPEQLKSSTDVDARADVWSLAVTLYELVTQSSPFDTSTLAMLHHSILAGIATDVRQARPDVPEPLARAIAWSLVTRREDRCPSVAAFAEAIVPFASPVGHEAFEMLRGAVRDARVSSPLLSAAAMRASGHDFGSAHVAGPGGASSGSYGVVAPNMGMAESAPNMGTAESAPNIQGATQGTFAASSNSERRRPMTVLVFGVGAAALAVVGAGLLVVSLSRPTSSPAPATESFANAGASAVIPSASATVPAPAVASDEPSPQASASAPIAPAVSSAPAAASPPRNAGGTRPPTHAAPRPATPAKPSSAPALPGDRK